MKDSWFEKYYPKAASEYANASDKECVEHALLKWQGIVDAKEFNLHHYRNKLVDVDSGKVILHIDVSSCALCVKHYDDDSCEGCPLAEMLGNSCDKNYGIFEQTLYQKSLSKPQLMVDALTVVLINLKNSYGENDVTDNTCLYEMHDWEELEDGDYRKSGPPKIVFEIYHGDKDDFEHEIIKIVSTKEGMTDWEKTQMVIEYYDMYFTDDDERCQNALYRLGL